MVLLHGVEIFLGTGYLGTEVITGDVSATACVASSLVVGDDAASVAAGDVATVTVHARDARGNALITGGSSFSVLARSGDVALAPSSLVDRRDGTYLATLAPVVSGTYAMAITRGGEHVHGSPFALTVVPGLTSASASYLTCASSATNCASRGDAVAGEEASFRVVAKDAHNNTNDRTTEVGGDSFFYSVIGEGGYVKWAVASAASRRPRRASRSTPPPRTRGRAPRASRSARRSRARRPSSCDRVASPEESTDESDGVPNAVAGETYAVTCRRAVDGARNASRRARPARWKQRNAHRAEGTDATLYVTDRGDGTYASRFGVNETGGWSLTPRAGQIVGFTASSVVVVAGARDLEATRVGGAVDVPSRAVRRRRLGRIQSHVHGRARE